MKKNCTKLYTPILFLAMLFSFASCCETVQCDPWRASEITTINFTDTELKILYVKKFSKNSNFSSAVDSMSLNSGNDYNLVAGTANTINIMLYVNGITPRFPIEVGYEYEFFFPNGNIVRRITELNDVSSDDRYCFTGFAKNVCYNRLNSLQIDGKASDSFILQR